MTATAANTKKPDEVGPSELFPPMRFLEKARLVGICCLLLVPAVLLCWRIAGPTDPYQAVTIVYHDNPLVALLTVLVFAAAGSAAATLLMAGRLSDFGAFAVGVGLTGLALRGGDLTVMLQYKAGTAAGRAGVFSDLAVDVVLWTFVPIVSLAVCAMTEGWAGLSGPAEIKPPNKPTSAKRPGPMKRWLERAALRTGAPDEWSAEVKHGLVTTVVTTVVAMVVIHVASGREVAPVNHVQVIFAIGVGFWLGAIAAGQFSRPALGVWVCLAVPIVALIGDVGGWLRPNLPAELAAYREIAIIPPNAWSKGLPIDYLSIGPAAAILGMWTSQRLRRAREEAVVV
ncbi:MAG: hypothetical protein JXQ73_28270 [Phycisphaerae bacterium]|nr:hypothetical protein [Phycisphaerae bacterium]